MIEKNAFTGVIAQNFRIYSNPRLTTVESGAFHGLHVNDVFHVGNNDALRTLSPGFLLNVSHLNHFYCTDNKNLDIIETGAMAGLKPTYDVKFSNNGNLTIESRAFEGLTARYIEIKDNGRLQIESLAFKDVKVSDKVSVFDHSGTVTMKAEACSSLTSRHFRIFNNGGVFLESRAFSGATVGYLPGFSEQYLEIFGNSGPISIASDAFNGASTFMFRLYNNPGLKKLPMGSLRGLKTTWELKVYGNGNLIIEPSAFEAVTARNIEIKDNGRLQIESLAFKDVKVSDKVSIYDNSGTVTVNAEAFEGVTLRNIEIKENSKLYVKSHAFKGADIREGLTIREASDFAVSALSAISGGGRIEVYGDADLKRLPTRLIENRENLNLRLEGASLETIQANAFLGCAFKNLVIARTNLTAVEASFLVETYESLVFEDNPRLSLLTPNAFSNITIKTLTFRGNAGLTRVPTDAFTGLTVTDKIVLEDNAYLTDFQPHAFLRGYINAISVVNNDGLRVIPAHAFENLDMTSLTLSRNKNLGVIAQGAFTNSRFSLYIIDSPSLHTIEVGALHQARVQALTLKATNMTVIPANVFGENVGGRLTIEYNPHLRRIESRAFAELQGVAKTLVNLYIRYNPRLETIGAEIVSGRRANYITIERNDLLHTLEAGIFREVLLSAAGYSYLRIRYNPSLVTLTKGTFDGVSCSYGEIHVVSNPNLRILESGSFSRHRGCMSVIQNNLKLKAIMPGIFQAAQTLVRISSSRDLETLPAEAFSGIDRSRVEIDVWGLKHISSRAFQNASKIHSLQIKTNNLHCCGAEWLAYGGIADQPALDRSSSNLVCGSPAHVKGRSLLLPVASGGLYDPVTKPRICVPQCPNSSHYAVQPGNNSTTTGNLSYGGFAVLGNIGAGSAGSGGGGGTGGSGGAIDYSWVFPCVERCAAGYLARTSSSLQTYQSSSADGDSGGGGNSGTGGLTIRECVRCMLPHTYRYGFDSNCAVCEAGVDPVWPMSPTNCTRCKPGYFLNPDMGCVRACDETPEGEKILHYGTTSMTGASSSGGGGPNPSPNPNSGSASAPVHQCHRCADFTNCAACPGTPEQCTRCVNGMVLHNGVCGTTCPADELRPGIVGSSSTNSGTTTTTTTTTKNNQQLLRDEDYLERWRVAGTYDPLKRQMEALYCEQVISPSDNPQMCSNPHEVRGPHHFVGSQNGAYAFTAAEGASVSLCGIPIADTLRRLARVALDAPIHAVWAAANEPDLSQRARAMCAKTEPETTTPPPPQGGGGSASKSPFLVAPHALKEHQALSIGGALVLRPADGSSLFIDQLDVVHALAALDAARLVFLNSTISSSSGSGSGSGSSGGSRRNHSFNPNSNPNTGTSTDAADLVLALAERSPRAWPCTASSLRAALLSFASDEKVSSTSNSVPNPSSKSPGLPHHAAELLSTRLFLQGLSNATTLRAQCGSVNFNGDHGIGNVNGSLGVWPAGPGHFIVVASTAAISTATVPPSPLRPTKSAYEAEVFHTMTAVAKAFL